jgi:hypothetical protein
VLSCTCPPVSSQIAIVASFRSHVAKHSFKLEAQEKLAKGLGSSMPIEMAEEIRKVRSGATLNAAQIVYLFRLEKCSSFSLQCQQCICGIENTALSKLALRDEQGLAVVMMFS